MKYIYVSLKTESHPVCSHKKVLLNIPHDKKGISKFPHTIL